MQTNSHPLSEKSGKWGRQEQLEKRAGGVGGGERFEVSTNASKASIILKMEFRNGQIANHQVKINADEKKKRFSS